MLEDVPKRLRSTSQACTSLGRGCWQISTRKVGWLWEGKLGRRMQAGHQVSMTQCRLPWDGRTLNRAQGSSLLNMGMGSWRCSCCLPRTTCHGMEWRMVQGVYSPMLACRRRPRSWGLQGEGWPKEEKGCFLP